MVTTLEEILNCEEFQKLRGIGGHKVYHLEGNAYVHTMMVIEEAKKMFPGDGLMVRVAALHDIGKIYTSICNGPDDWSYPDHSIAGSLKGILAKFISLQDEDFEKIQWYIRNHVKPLFWNAQNFGPIEMLQVDDSAPIGCSLYKLARLAVCDLRGSVSTVDQTELINFLMGL